MTMTGVRRVAALLFAGAACGGDSPVALKPLVLVARGRAERGLTVHVALQRDGDSTLVVAKTITTSPADAAMVSANGDVLLIKAGTTTISATTPDGTALTLAIAVAVPPTVVFDGLAASNRDVYRVSLDGTDLTRLTTHAADDVHPTAVGGVLVFTSFRDGNAELYTVSIDGAGERKRTDSRTAETQPSLSPDGKRVAYTSNASGVLKVWIASIDLASTAQISGAAALSPASFGNSFSTEATPAWAPASDRLVLVATATPSGGSGLFTAAATAGTLPVLVVGSGTQIVELEPSWSSDGFRFAYASPVSGSSEIFIRDVRTSTVTQLTRNTGSSGHPAWLPDGRVLFTTFAGTTSTIRWVDPALPRELHTITTTGLVAEHPAPVRP